MNNIDLKAAGRWLIRRDAEASGTRMAGWIDRFSQFASPVIGITNGFREGLIVFACLWVVRMIVGYFDLNYVKVHAYGLWYLSEKAPSQVVIRDKSTSS